MSLIISSPLGRLHATIAAVCPINGLSGGQGSVTIDYAVSATTPQKTAAASALASFDWSQAAQDAWQLTQDRANAWIVFNADKSPTAKIIRAQFYALLDQFNAIQTAFQQLRNDVRVVAPSVPAVTYAQISVAAGASAVQNKLNSGAAD